MLEDVSLEVIGNSDVIERDLKNLSKEKDDIDSSIDLENLKSACDKCQKLFAEGKKLRDHIKICVSREKSAKTLTEGHKNTNLEMTEEIVDEVVEQTIDKAENARAYVEIKVTEENELKCDVCKQPFFTVDLLNTHLKIHLNDRISKNQNNIDIPNALKCSICNETIEDRMLLEYHILNVHGSEQEYTGEPDKVLDIIDKIHCDVCDYKASNDEEMLMHIETGHLKEFLYICGVCAKSFDEEKECITHMNTHQNTNLTTSPIPTFPCDECNDIFLEISILKNHKIETHKTINLDKSLNEGSDYNNLEKKIDSSLNTLHGNIYSSFKTLKIE